MQISAGNRLNVSDAWCEALFASWLQPSDAPTAERVGEAVNCTVRQFGIRGCAGQMAQEFGDHPEAAAERMRWIRQLAAEAPARPQPNSGPPRHPPHRCLTRELPADAGVRLQGDVP